MKRLLSLALVLLSATTVSVAQTRRHSVEDAQELVKRAVAHYKAHGADRAFRDFSRSPGPFVDGDLYVTVYSLDGKCLAHILPTMIGRNLIDARDPEGKPLIRERMELASTRGRGYQDLTWFNPVSRKIEPKRTYFERHDGYVFSAGAYGNPRN